MTKRLKSLAEIISSLGLWAGLTFILKNRFSSINSISLADTPYHIKSPIILRPNTSDLAVFKQVFVYKEYDITLSFEPSIIVDAGANVGLASIYFRSRYPQATIIAIEPDADNAIAFRRNLSPYSKVHLVQASLWHEKAQTVMVDKYKMGKWGMMTETIEEGTEFNTLTMDELFQEFSLSYIDVLKLDIESAEKQLFSGNYMDWLPKVKVIIIELHDWVVEGCSKPFFLAINEAFSAYSFHQVGENTVIINHDLMKKQ